MTHAADQSTVRRASINPLAIASVAASVISYVVFPFLLAAIGIILGLVARSQIQKSGQGGRRLAIAGIVIGVIGIIWGIIGLVVLEYSMFMNVPS